MNGSDLDHTFGTPEKTGIKLEASNHSSSYTSVIPAKMGIQSKDIIKSGDSQTYNFEKGFSLLEVLISLLIITIVTGIAAVSLGPYWQKHQLQQATRQLMEQIQVCRTKAIIECRTYQIKIADQSLYRRYKSDADWSDWEPQRINGPARISMNGTTYFYSKGFVSPKTITVMNDTYRQKIIININGRARISDIF